MVEAADEIQITLHDGKQFEATLVGSDPEADVALLKVEAENLTDIAMADSDKLRVIGEVVVGMHIYIYNMDDNLSLIRDLIAKKMKQMGDE